MWARTRDARRDHALEGLAAGLVLDQQRWENIQDRTDRRRTTAPACDQREDRASRRLALQLAHYHDATATKPGKNQIPAIGAIAAIAAIVLPAAGFGYLVTTFLFAFSGGQSRMVAVVNLGALAVIGFGVLVAAVTWILRSPLAAIIWTAIATGVGWVAVVIAEWLISFQLGAA